MSGRGVATAFAVPVLALVALLALADVDWRRARAAKVRHEIERSVIDQEEAQRAANLETEVLILRQRLQSYLEGGEVFWVAIAEGDTLWIDARTATFNRTEGKIEPMLRVGVLTR